MASNLEMTIVVVIGIVGGCVALWQFVVRFTSWFSGWGRLAQIYPARPAGSDVKCYPYQLAKLGRAMYKGSVTFHTEAEGLHMSVISIFKPAHPPLFIPWTDIKLKGSEKRFGVEWVEYELARAAPIPFRLMKETAENLAECSVGLLKVP